jgi:hypothetical protein
MVPDEGVPLMIMVTSGKGWPCGSLTRPVTVRFWAFAWLTKSKIVRLTRNNSRENLGEQVLSFGMDIQF